MFQMDLDATIATGAPISPDESTTTDLATKAEIIDWFNDSSVLVSAETNAGSDNIPVTVAGWFGDLTGGDPVQGKTPPMTATNWGYLMTEIETEALIYVFRHIVVADDIDILNSDTSTGVGGYRSYLDDWKLLEIALRDAEPTQPVEIFTGCEIGDTFSATSAVDSPETRAAATNNDHFHITDVACDDLPSYLSFAPWLAGNLSGNKVNHNTTRDVLPFSTIEQQRSNRDTQVKPRIQAGVTTIITMKDGVKVAYGNNTLQDNAELWTSISTTHNIMQRQQADYCNYTLNTGLDTEMIGMDGVTAQILHSYVNQTAKSLMDEGIIDEYDPAETQVRAASGGWLIDWSVILSRGTDFIGLTTKILVTE